MNEINIYINLLKINFFEYEFPYIYYHMDNGKKISVRFGYGEKKEFTERIGFLRKFLIKRYGKEEKNTHILKGIKLAIDKNGKYRTFDNCKHIYQKELCSGVYCKACGKKIKKAPGKYLKKLFTQLKEEENEKLKKQLDNNNIVCNPDIIIDSICRPVSRTKKTKRSHKANSIRYFRRKARKFKISRKTARV